MLMILNPVIECQGKSVFCCICKSAGEGVFQKILPPLSFWKRFQFPTGAEHPLVSAPAVHFIFLSFKWALMFGRPFLFVLIKA